ncbi:hypothetical protein DH2020_031449 [Rehmannia glutinosa]|uniref:Acyl-[acyl-carrier-protein] desaturase n=1 Tax=Rehmannia glutinosa TaxID=99300 RepID=A0ABR0VLE3_REHGL
MQTLAFFNITTTPLACMLSGGATNSRRQKPISAVAKLPPPTLRRHQITHSMPPEKVEVFKSLEPWASKHVLPLLKPVDKCWQPSEFLPDSTKPVNDFIDEVRALQDRTIGLPDEYFVVLVGDMITEEALPTYQTVLNSFDGVRDQTGASPSSWATWIRAWTAEENRHGDLLKTYLYLSGRVDMLMIERTVQYLIGAGCVRHGLENNPYLGFVYTSFQERATFVSHGNTARLAKEGGDPILARMCANIAADEKRHENAYVTIIEKLLEIDPNETMLAIGNMMRKKIVMPAHLMYDGRDPNIFEHFSYVANRLRIYTASDYADILEFLVGRWRLEKLEGLKSDGRCEQEFVCGLGARIRKLQERADERAEKVEPQRLKFSWIFNNHKMSNAKDVKFTLKVMINKQKSKVLFAEAGSDFVDVLLSFLTLPLGRIVMVLNDHYGDKTPAIGSLTTLYKGLSNLDDVHFPSMFDKFFCSVQKAQAHQKQNVIN